MKTTAQTTQVTVQHLMYLTLNKVSLPVTWKIEPSNMCTHAPHLGLLDLYTERVGLSSEKSQLLSVYF